MNNDTDEPDDLRDEDLVEMDNTTSNDLRDEDLVEMDNTTSAEESDSSDGRRRGIDLPLIPFDIPVPDISNVRFPWENIDIPVPNLPLPNLTNFQMLWERDGAVTGGLLDYVLVQLLFRNILDEYDPCGVVNDLVNVLLFPGQDQRPLSVIMKEIIPEESLERLNNNDRNLQTSTPPDTCNNIEILHFNLQLYNFAKCAGFDVFNLLSNSDLNMMESISVPVINCIDSVFMSRGTTCSQGGRYDDFRDDCMEGFLGNDIIGTLLRTVVTAPLNTCECMDHLYSLPNCQFPMTNGVIDGILAKRIGCAVQTQYCPWYGNSVCSGRLRKLNECIPSMTDLVTDFNQSSCQAVLCHCESLDNGDFNFAGRMMSLPLADMCVEQAHQNSPDLLIPERFAEFQRHCGKVIDPNPITSTSIPAPSATVPPSTTSFPPSQMPALAPALTFGGPNDPLIVGAIAANNATPRASTSSFILSGFLAGLGLVGFVGIVFVVIFLIVRRQRRIRKNLNMKGGQNDGIKHSLDLESYDHEVGHGRRTPTPRSYATSNSSSVTSKHKTYHSKKNSNKRQPNMSKDFSPKHKSYESKASKRSPKYRSPSTRQTKNSP